MSLRRPTRLQLAMHEAGHAVMMMANDPPPRIRSISIINQPAGRWGYVDVDARWQPWMADEPLPSSPAGERAFSYHRRMASLDLLEHLAGPVAEQRHRLRNRLSVMLNGRRVADTCINRESELEPGSDEHRVIVRLRWLGGPNLRDSFEQAWIETEEAVARHWRRIVELGRWLERKGRIEGAALSEWWSGKMVRP